MSVTFYNLPTTEAGSKFQPPTLSSVQKVAKRARGRSSIAQKGLICAQQLVESLQGTTSISTTTTICITTTTLITAPPLRTLRRLVFWPRENCLISEEVERLRQGEARYTARKLPDIL